MLSYFQLLYGSGIYLGCIFSLLFNSVGRREEAGEHETFFKKGSWDSHAATTFQEPEFRNQYFSIGIGQFPKEIVRAECTRMNPVCLNTKGEPLCPGV